MQEKASREHAGRVYQISHSAVATAGTSCWSPGLRGHQGLVMAQPPVCGQRLFHI